MNKRPGSAALPLLRFDEVEVRIGSKSLLRDVMLEIPPVGMFGLVGPNGAGKSTLLRAALALQPVARGRVWLHDRPIERWRPQELARAVGYVPQQIQSHWDLTVAELLQLALAPPSPRLLADFELGPLLQRRFNTLSGGEQARAAIVRAMAHQPALLLADEPAAHLDLPHQHALMRQLQHCAQRAAVLVVLHDLHLAARYCDRVAVLASGRLAAVGAPTEVLQPLVLASAYEGPLRRLDSAGHAFFTVAHAEMG